MVKKIVLAVMLGMAAAVSFSAIGPISTVRTLSLVGVTFANLSGALTRDGQIAYCSDCTIANPCAGGGTGAIAKRLNGVNVCN